MPHHTDRAQLVETLLCRGALLSGRNLRFEFEPEALVLRGVVRSYYQKQLAQETLRSIAGVGTIRNEIEVISL